VVLIMQNEVLVWLLLASWSMTFSFIALQVRRMEQGSKS